MPLPRFDRLPADARAAILAVARAHFARDGKDGASFNQIIADAGISKSSAYHYFDGKDDLFGAVVAEVADRVVAVLGPWIDVETEDDLWEQVAAGATRLVAYLREHPDDQAVLSAQPPDHQDGESWIHSLIANGRRIGLINPYPSIELVTVATMSIFHGLDAWALEQPDELDQFADVLVLFLSRLWN